MGASARKGEPPTVTPSPSLLLLPALPLNPEKLPHQRMQLMQPPLPILQIKPIGAGQIRQAVASPWAAGGMNP